MPVMWAVLFGVSTPFIMWLAIRMWLPVLGKQSAELAMTDEAENMKPDPGQFMPRTRFFQKNIWCITFLLGCGLFAALCGYAAANYASSPLNFARIWIVFCVLACVTVVDLELFLIPNKCSVFILVSGCVLLVAQWIADGVFPNATLLESALSLVVCLVLLLIMSAITRGGLGMGDVKILSSIAFLCGIRPVCYILTLALILSAMGSSILLLTKKKQLKDLLPLGPFLWIAMGLLILLRLI